jgi:hypothetical protein
VIEGAVDIAFDFASRRKIEWRPYYHGEGIGIATAPISDFADAAIDTIVVPGALNIEPALHDRRWARGEVYCTCKWRR